LYAKRNGLHDAQNELAEAKLIIERRLGSVLSGLPREQGKRSGTSGHGDTKLQSTGIPKKTAQRYQKEAEVPEEDFVRYIAESRDKGKEITQAGLLKIAQRQEQYEPVKPPPLPEGEYSVILADPPWKYDFAPHRDGMSIEEHYPTMEIGEIAALQVPAADNAVLFLWATSPKLVEALQVMHCWDFKYKTSFVWDKEKESGRGAWKSGYWSLSRHELLLVGTKGSFSPPHKDLRVPSVIRARRTAHSKKPDAVYEIIESYFPEHERVELFARNTRKGWNNWGHDA
jgi:N6-adenosine-specific RNA methylase IME4